jgi:hypothetical protein
MFKPVTSLFLALLILISSIGVSGQVHDCRVKGRLIGLYGSAVSCCSILRVKHKRAIGSCCKLKKTNITTIRRVPCCQDQVRYQHLDIQQVVKKDVTSEFRGQRFFTVLPTNEMLPDLEVYQKLTSVTPRAQPPPLRWDPQARFCQYRC